MRKWIKGYDALITPGCHRVRLWIWVLLMGMAFGLGAVEQGGLTAVIVLMLDMVCIFTTELICFPGIWDRHAAGVLYLRTAPGASAVLRAAVRGDAIVRAVRKLTLGLSGLLAMVLFNGQGIAGIGMTQIMLIVIAVFGMYGADNLIICIVRRITLSEITKIGEVLLLTFSYLFGYMVIMGITLVVYLGKFEAFAIGATCVAVCLAVGSTIYMLVWAIRAYDEFLGERSGNDE